MYIYWEHEQSLYKVIIFSFEIWIFKYGARADIINLVFAEHLIESIIELSRDSIDLELLPDDFVL